MTLQLLDRVESSTSWHEASGDDGIQPPTRAEEASTSAAQFLADDKFITFVLYGTNAGHPRTTVGAFDDRCLYWQRSNERFKAKLYGVPFDLREVRNDHDARARPLRVPADNVKALRELTGLTWEQIARLFGVSRRSVHLWAAGGKLSAANEELLAEVVDIIRGIEASSPERVRHELFRVRSETGLSVYDELRSRHASTSSDINRPAGSAY